MLPWPSIWYETGNICECGETENDLIFERVHFSTALTLQAHSRAQLPDALYIFCPLEPQKKSELRLSGIGWVIFEHGHLMLRRSNTTLYLCFHERIWGSCTVAHFQILGLSCFKGRSVFISNSYQEIPFAALSWNFNHFTQ